MTQATASTPTTSLPQWKRKAGRTGPLTANEIQAMRRHYEKVIAGLLEDLEQFRARLQEADEFIDDLPSLMSLSLAIAAASGVELSYSGDSRHVHNPRGNTLGFRVEPGGHIEFTAGFHQIQVVNAVGDTFRCNLSGRSLTPARLQAIVTVLQGGLPSRTDSDS